MQATNSVYSISQHALITRMRRRMRRHGGMFHITRERWHRDHGLWHASDQTRYLTEKWDSMTELIEYARRAGVLGAHEDVAS